MYKIYLICADTEGVVQWKVGITKNLDNRLQILNVGNPNIVGYESYYEIDSRVIAYKVENLVKNHLKQYKLKGEWFSHESLNRDIFQNICEKCEANANIWLQIQNNINNDKNKIYR